MRYVWRGGRFVDPVTGEPMHVPDGPPAAPRLMRDIPEYRSPIDGKLITSRSQRREDLRANDCIEGEPPRHKVFRSKRFADANRAEHDPNYRRRTPVPLELPD